MNIFNKNIFWSVFLAMLATGAVVYGAVVLFLYAHKPEHAVWYFLGGIVVLIAVSAGIFWYRGLYPMHTIFKEMKAMLAGHRYRRVLTGRTDEVGILAHFFNEVTKDLEKIEGRVKEGKRMSSELALASKIQKRVLPSSMPDVPGLDLYAATRAAVEVGGDSFDVIPAKNNTFIYVGDVTGHGTPSALVMMMVNILVDLFCEQYESAYEVVVNINRMLKPRIDATIFMTMAMLRWSHTERQMYVTGAGHEHVIIHHRGTGITEIRQTGGIALGMLPDNSKITKEESLNIQNGDLVLLYTDGIIEAQNTKGEMYGLKRLQAMVAKFAPTAGPEKLFNHIFQDFGEFVENQTQADDITLVIAQVK